MSFFFAQNQLKSPSSSSSSIDSDVIKTPNDDSIKEALAAVSLDEKLDNLKRDILFELRLSLSQQEATLNDINNHIITKTKDTNNDDNTINIIIDIPLFLLRTIWMTVGIIPYLGPLLQLLIIINVICFILSLLPSIAYQYLLIIIKYIVFSLIPMVFTPLINASKAIVYDQGFVELRHFIGYLIANIKELMLSDMFQGVYNTKILSSLNQFNSSSLLAAGEVLFDGTTVADSYSYFKDSLSKLYK